MFQSFYEMPCNLFFLSFFTNTKLLEYPSLIHSIMIQGLNLIISIFYAELIVNRLFIDPIIKQFDVAY